MIEINMNEVNESLKNLREEFDKKSVDLGKIEKIETILGKQEEENQKLSLKLNEAAKEAEQTKKDFAELEAKLMAPGLHRDEKEEAKLEIKAFENYVCKGKKMEAENVKYLRTDINNDGGYLVPITQEFDIIKKITEISPIRTLAKVRTMPSKTGRMPTRSALVTAGYMGEGTSFPESKSQYGREELVAKKLGVRVIVTNEELQDATPNLVAEINSDVGEAFAKAEGAAFTNGNDVNSPEGFMTNPNVPSIKSGLATAINFDNFATLEGELKTGYNAIYGFNRRTLAQIRNLKDAAGAYIWRAGNLGAGIPNSIAGQSYVEIPDMPNIGAGTFPIIYGDFNMGYLIGDRLGITALRDENSLSDNDKTKFIFKKRHDGQVVLPEAFVKLEIGV